MNTNLLIKHLQEIAAELDNGNTGGALDALGNVIGELQSASQNPTTTLTDKGVSVTTHKRQNFPPAVTIKTASQSWVIRTQPGGELNVFNQDNIIIIPNNEVTVTLKVPY